MSNDVQVVGSSPALLTIWDTYSNPSKLLVLLAGDVSRNFSQPVTLNAPAFE